MKIPNMATMEDRRRPIMYLEHGDLPDPAAETARSVLREQDKLQERFTVLENASEIAPTKDESLEKIRIEATFSKGGEI